MHRALWLSQSDPEGRHDRKRSDPPGASPGRSQICKFGVRGGTSRMALESSFWLLVENRLETNRVWERLPGSQGQGLHPSRGPHAVMSTPGQVSRLRGG